MKKISSLALLMLCAAVVACHKKNPESASASAVEAASVVAGMPAPVGEARSPDGRTGRDEKKKDLLEYSTMEDQYLNDPKGRATSAKASAYYGEGSKSTSNAPSNAMGAPNGETWSNAQQDMVLTGSKSVTISQ